MQKRSGMRRVDNLTATRAVLALAKFLAVISNDEVRRVCVCLHVDVSFMTCLPSALAVSSLSAAATGLIGHVWCRQTSLLHRLQQLTNIDDVSHFTLARSFSLSCLYCTMVERKGIG